MHINDAYGDFSANPAANSQSSYDVLVTLVVKYSLHAEFCPFHIQPTSLPKDDNGR
jgi:hypothetical protein